MVQRDLVTRGVVDPRVLDAMRTVPRDRFVERHLASVPYEDHPLRIGTGQTISQPYMVAVMAEMAELTPSSRVLEIGTGSGYGAAVLGEVAGDVWTIERHEGLATEARERLEALGYDNVHVVEGDGTLGLPDGAPFDAIVVTAAPEHVPQPLLDQLKVGGRLVIPVGSQGWSGQEILRITRTSDGYERESILPVRFVPMTGEARDGGAR